MIAASRSLRGHSATNPVSPPDSGGPAIAASTRGAVPQAPRGIPAAHARRPATPQDIPA
jgi:hypothetical protein